MTGFRVGVADPIIAARPAADTFTRANYLGAVANRVDSFWVPDHLNQLFPRSLWKQKYCGAIKLIPTLDADSDLIEVSGTYRDWLDFQNWLLGTGPLTEPTESHLRAFISHAHEHMHRVNFHTTPFGLLMWRIDLTLTTDARYLVKWFGRPPGGVALTDHCRKQPLRPPTSADEEEQQRYVSDVVGELERLVGFRAGLWAGAPDGLTLGELAHEGNEILAILRKRFDLHTTWNFTTTRPNDPATVSVPYLTSYGLQDVVESFGARDVFERNATIWERLCLWFYAAWRQVPVSVEKLWPESVQLWSDWRLAASLYQDLGDLNDLVNLESHKKLAVFALSGPCDPALDLDIDVPIEAALPAMRWAAAHPAAADPTRRNESFGYLIRGVPDDVEAGVFGMLARVPLNGQYGLFANSLRSNNAERSYDPLRSYHAFVLHRFQDEFWRMALRETGLPTLRQLPGLNPLTTLFDEFCLVQHTELLGYGPLDVAATGDLLLQLFFEHIDQQLANHDVGKEPVEIEQLYRRMSPMAERLCRDFRSALPTELGEALKENCPERLLALAIKLYEGRLPEL